MSMMTYKNYFGTVQYSAEDKCLFGKLAFIRDLVNYEATTVERLEIEFKAAVDDYLKQCEETKKQPDSPCKGTFNVRTGSPLHRQAVMASGDRSLNAFVIEAIQEKLERENV